MESLQTRNVVLVGVGGQGILLASEIVAQAAVVAGFRVKTNEVHGMAQRGGSVTAQIRYGAQVYSPLVARGTAHVLVSLEQIEALRFCEYLAPGGLAVVNSLAITPVTVSMGAAKYPKDVRARLDQVFGRVVYADAGQIAKDLGDIRAANVVLLGAASQDLDLSEDHWRQAIRLCVKPKTLDLNLKAFEAGRGLKAA